jgi:hypothetical protein
LQFVTLHLHLDFSFEFVDYVIFGGLCDDYELPMMNIYACDEFIYACDDLCEYLRLLEKRKKGNFFADLLLSAKGPCALGRGAFFAERQIHSSRRREHFQRELNNCSRRREHLQRERNILLSVKGPPSTRAKYFALDEGVAPTPNGGTVS